MSTHSDIQKLIEQIKTNLNGKHIYDAVFPLEGNEYIGEAIAAALDVPVVANTTTPFTLVVEHFYNKENRKKYWAFDYAVLYKKDEDESPTYYLDGVDIPEMTDEDKERDVIRQLLVTIGEDPDREGLKETPKRVIKFYKEFMSPEEFNFTVFNSEDYDEMIVQKDIPFFSLCEHHMAPFFGTATVAYIPNGKIVGLSKLARTVEHFSRRLQNQERITMQIAEKLQSELNPLGVAVVLEARHFCMEMRGIKTHDVTTSTSRLIGAFKDEPETRAEFMIFLKG